MHEPSVFQHKVECRNLMRIQLLTIPTVSWLRAECTNRTRLSAGCSHSVGIRKPRDRVERPGTEPRKHPTRRRERRCRRGHAHPQTGLLLPLFVSLTADGLNVFPFVARLFRAGTLVDHAAGRILRLRRSSELPARAEPPSRLACSVVPDEHHCSAYRCEVRFTFIQAQAVAHPLARLAMRTASSTVPSSAAMLPTMRSQSCRSSISFSIAGIAFETALARRAISSV